MLTNAQKQQAFQFLKESDLPASKKRAVVREITNPSATPQSVIGIVGAAGIGMFLGHKYLRDNYFDNPGIGSGNRDDDFKDLEPIPDRDDVNPVNPGHRVPIGDDDPDNDDKSDPVVSRPDPDTDNNDQITDDRLNPPPEDDPRLPTDHDQDRDGDGKIESSGGSSIFPDFSTLIQSLISKWTDATVTGGEEIRNQWDLDKMEASNEFSAQQAEISRDWQEQMYQKYNSLPGKIAQAEQAGVNPLFAVSGGVSPTGFSSASPSGSVASGSGSPSGNNLSGMLSALASLFKIKSEIRATDAKASKDEAETKTIDATRDLTLQQMSADILNTGSSTQLNLQKVVESFTSIEKLKADMNLSNAQADAVAGQVALLEAQTNYLNLTGPYDVRIKSANALLAEWQEKNKTLFKGIDIGMDVINMIADVGLGIVQARTGLKLAENVLNK